LLWDIALIGIAVLLAIVSVVTLAISSLRSRRRRRRAARPPPVKFCRLCGTRLDRHQKKLRALVDKTAPKRAQSNDKCALALALGSAPNNNKRQPAGKRARERTTRAVS
jgi:hypothetical protein